MFELKQALDQLRNISQCLAMSRNVSQCLAISRTLALLAAAWHRTADTKLCCAPSVDHRNGEEELLVVVRAVTFSFLCNYSRNTGL
eukprot:SAG31_NODE_21740_length_542_cov_0.582393_1_plen_86_part_00